MTYNSHTDRLFAFLIYFTTFVIHVKSALYGTLNFDRENLALLVLNKDSLKIGHELAIACPAQSRYEEDFNRDYSLGKNSLFVRGIYGSFAAPSTIPENTCAHIYKMSICYHTVSKEFVFGYEVYYNRQQYSRFKDSNYADFVSVEKAFSRKRRITSRIGLSSTPKLELQQESDKPAALGFVWLLMFRLKFDNSTKNPIQVIYTLSKITEMGVECDDDSLGKEVYKQKDQNYVNSLYKNQVKIFNNVEMPATDKGCEIENSCLVKYSLIPAEEFRFRSPEPKNVSCSNLTTVPIWKRTTQAILQKLDKFLYALIKFAYTLTVKSGVHGQLTMKNSKLRGIKKITLADGNEMPAPNIIYKLIKYEFEAKEKEYGYYKITNIQEAIIIVVHNHPQFNPEDALCPADNCIKLGFSEILKEAISSTSESPINNNIYCCPRNEEIVNKLGMEYDNKFSKELNLTEFIVYDDKLLEMKTEDIQQKVTDEMKKMFGNESLHSILEEA